jgi:hypothetical protein
MELRSSQIILPEGQQKHKRLTTTFGDTLSAQFGRTFGPAMAELGYYTSKSDYDPESLDRVENYIDQNSITGANAHYLRSFGIGSLDNFQAALQHIARQEEVRNDLDASTGANLFVTDIGTLVSLAIPVAGFAATKGLTSAFSIFTSQSARTGASKLVTERLRREFGDELSDIVRFAPERLRDVKGVGAKVQGRIEAGPLGRPVDLAARSWTMLSGETFSAAQLSKITALDAAVSDGSINIVDALNQLELNADPYQVIKNAAMLTAGVTVFSGGLGYGLGRLAGAPAKNPSRVAEFSKRYKEYLKTTSSMPTKETDVSYAGSWFTNSIFMKAVPTPVRNVVQSKFLPDWAKEELLQVGGDNGMVFAANQTGRSFGNSVFLETARRNGDWYRALESINEAYRRVSPRGNAEIFNIPVQSGIERIRKAIGKDSFAPDEWYNHIGRLMADDVPYDKMTPDEAASVQAARGFFEKYEKELVDVGLMNPRDVFTDTYIKEYGRQSELVSITQSIIAQNKKWMTGHVDILNQRLLKKEATLDKLQSTFTSRGLTKNQQKLRDDLNKEVSDLRKRLDYFQDRMDIIDAARGVDEVLEELNKLDLTPDMLDGLGNLQKAMNDTRKRAENASEMIERSRGMDTPTNYLFRIFNRRKIEQDREGLKSILMAHFRENNEIIRVDDTGLFKVVKLATDDASVAKRADQTIDNILGETDEDAIDAIFTGFGRSGPLMSRRLNIPNSKIKDYIVTDIKELMIGYTGRVAPKIEFHKRFRNPENGKLMTLEARLEYLRERLRKEGVSEKEISKYIKNYVSVYDQVVGTTLKRPDAIDTKAANFLRTAASWTFLGGSGVAALGDAASLFMDHELSTIGKAFLGTMDDVSLKLGKKEANLAGEALEIVRGTTHLKYLESLSNDIFTKSVPDRLNNAFYIANLLAPVTVAIKSMDALLRSHTIIEASLKKANGTKLSSFEVEFLARYNIDDVLAKKIAESPFEKSEGNLYLANTEAWTDEDAVIGFRNALNSGILNRVIMGTPADKPMMMNGVAYIPESVASKLPFELPVDPRVPGYRRAESGLLALPFTFYSYTMGALAKITANHASGSVRNRMSHIAVALGLGYMIVKYRTPSWAWDDMDTEDKIARSFDFSGLAALYSDAGYRALAMHNELGFESNFPIQPKYSGEADPLGAILSLGGAPVDWGYAASKAITEMMQGNFSDGAKDLISVTPLIETMVTGDVIKETAKDITGYLPNRQ